MECKIKNDLGTIYIAEDVMLKVVGYAALECYGIVAMCSKRAKDGLVEWLGRENLSKGVSVRLVDDQLDVDLFIVVEYFPWKASAFDFPRLNGGKPFDTGTVD